MKLIKANKNVIYNYLLVFILLYVSNDTLLFGTNSNRMFFWMQVGILIGIFMLLAINTRKINKQVLACGIILILMFAFTQITNMDSEFIKYIYNIFLVCFTVLFVSKINRDVFLNAYLDIIFVFACISIISFLLSLVWKSIFSYFPIIVNESGDSFFYILFTLVPTKILKSIPRMYGIFREPGVYTCFLSMALIIDLFLIPNKSIKKTLVITCTMLLTFSTAAFILLGIVYFIYFINEFFETDDKKKKNRALFILLLISIILIIVIVGKEKIWNVVFKKLYVENDSLDARIGSIEGNIRLFLSNPISGRGWGFLEDNFATYAAQGIFKGKHNTNTLLKYLALYGIVPFTIIVTGMSSFFCSKIKKKSLALLCALVWIIALCNEDLNTNIIFYIIPFYGIKFMKVSKWLKPYRNNSVKEK